MFSRNRTTWASGAALLLCAVLLTDVATASPPALQSVAVTPALRSLSVGQKQRYTATGTFSDGSNDPSKATITMRGLATAVAPGNTTITPTTAGFINDNAVLTVK